MAGYGFDQTVYEMMRYWGDIDIARMDANATYSKSFLSYGILPLGTIGYVHYVGAGEWIELLYTCTSCSILPV